MANRSGGGEMVTDSLETNDLQFEVALGNQIRVKRSSRSHSTGEL